MFICDQCIDQYYYMINSSIIYDRQNVETT